jgi:hypothetical protein
VAVAIWVAWPLASSAVLAKPVSTLIANTLALTPLSAVMASLIVLPLLGS